MTEVCSLRAIHQTGPERSMCRGSIACGCVLGEGRGQGKLASSPGRGLGLRGGKITKFRSHRQALCTAPYETHETRRGSSVKWPSTQLQDTTNRRFAEANST